MIEKLTVSLKRRLEQTDKFFGKYSTYLGNHVIFTKGGIPIGIITLRKEPKVFLGTVGTKFGDLCLIKDKCALVDWKEITEFAKLRNLSFLTTKFSREETDDIRILKDQGFVKYESSLLMVNDDLNRYNYINSSFQRYQVSNREESDHYFRIVLECMKGSPDERAQRILERVNSYGEKIFDFKRMRTWIAMTTIFLYKPREEILGLVELNSSRQRLSNIGVLPEHRGKGIARQLVELAVTKAITLGFSSLTLRVSEKNVPAYNLYKHYKFKEIERIDHYWLLCKE
ncbi:MAG: GNAT family N-acetyltransferase [Candidatus Hodarchaeales archaeon]|jgi:GNAT superfamily N-acetyltransferase